MSEIVNDWLSAGLPAPQAPVDEETVDNTEVPTDDIVETLQAEITELKRRNAELEHKLYTVSAQLPKPEIELPEEDIPDHAVRMFRDRTGPLPHTAVVHKSEAPAWSQAGWNYA